MRDFQAKRSRRSCFETRAVDQSIDVAIEWNVGRTGIILIAVTLIALEGKTCFNIKDKHPVTTMIENTA